LVPGSGVTSVPADVSSHAFCPAFESCDASPRPSWNEGSRSSSLKVQSHIVIRVAKTSSECTLPKKSPKGSLAHFESVFADDVPASAVKFLSPGTASDLRCATGVLIYFQSEGFFVPRFGIILIALMVVWFLYAFAAYFH
jgi:hypothetical protein